VEDWELFFEEKSRRRADTVRRRAAIRIARRSIAAILFLALLTGIFLIIQ
jgi:hypothetical protein